MSRFQFAGKVSGRAQTSGERYGTKDSGMSTSVGGWRGMIYTHVWYDKEKECDRFRVEITPHWNDSGKDIVLAEGILDHRIDDPFVVPTLFA